MWQMQLSLGPCALFSWHSLTHPPRGTCAKKVTEKRRRRRETRQVCSHMHTHTEKKDRVPLRHTSIIRKMSQNRSTHAHKLPETRPLTYIQHDAARKERGKRRERAGNGHVKFALLHSVTGDASFTSPDPPPQPCGARLINATCGLCAA